MLDDLSLSNCHGLVQFTVSSLNVVRAHHRYLLKELRRYPWSLRCQKLELVISVELLLHLRDALLCPSRALNCLEVYQSSFVKVVELALMPVSLSVAELLLLLLPTVNHWNIILKIF